MTGEELQTLKKDLEKERDLILSELERFTDRNPVVKGDYRARFPKFDSTDTPDEKAHNVTDYEEKRAVEQNLELRLKEINETLNNINRGSFGVCHRCQSPIEEKRLKAIPVARFCLSCAKDTRLL